MASIAIYISSIMSNKLIFLPTSFVKFTYYPVNPLDISLYHKGYIYHCIISIVKIKNVKIFCIFLQICPEVYTWHPITNKIMNINIFCLAHPQKYIH
jgi:hypothetical protein